MNFDSFYEQADVAITDYCDDVGIDLNLFKKMITLWVRCYS